MSVSKTLKASVIIGGSISSAFRSAMSTTKGGLKAIGEEIAKVERRQRMLGTSIQTFGRMGKNVDGLRQQYAAAAHAADKLRAAQTRLALNQQAQQANTARRQQLGGELRTATAAFGAVALTSLAPVRSAVEFETAMLGVAKQLDGARDAAGNLTPVYFSMARQVQHLGRELPIATNQIAEMVAAGLRMGVAKDEVIGFTRTAAMMADAFELPAGQLADDMGKIAGLFAIPIPKIGALADAINYLDDNAISKGGEIIDVMRRVGGMAATLKMPAKEAAALGSTFLHLGSSAEVAGTATNAVMRILGAATAQSKRVRTGLASLGFKPEDIQATMSKDATQGILSVLDALNALDNEKRMVAATQIFGAEYGDDIAKLSTGAAEYRRQLALVNGEQAKGSMSREFNARLKTTAAQWEIMKNRVREVSQSLGSALLPAVNDLLKTAAPVVERFAEWSRENPRFVRGVVGSALAVTGMGVAVKGAAYAFTAIKGPVLSVMGFIARWRATGALAAMGRFGPVAMRVVGAVKAIGASIAAIGAGPIAAVLAGVAVVGLAVRKYWQPIRAWIGGAFDGVRESIAPVFAELGAALAPLKPAWDGVSSAIGAAWGWVVKLIEPVDMTAEQLAAAGESGRGFGRMLGTALTIGVRQITAVVKAVTWLGQSIGTAAGWIAVNFGVAWDKVKSVVGASVDWIMERVRPILSIGDSIAGAVRWAFGSDTPKAVTSPQARPAAARRGPPAITPARGRAAPTMAAQAGRGAVAPSYTDASSHTYNITQQPGESSEALARRIEAERRRNEGVARRRSLVEPTG